MPDGTEFGIVASPNPSQNQFHIEFRSRDVNSSVTLHVFDNNGRVIEIKERLAIGQSITIGHNYRPGAYLLVATQGNNKATIKLLRLPEY